MADHTGDLVPSQTVDSAVATFSIKTTVKQQLSASDLATTYFDSLNHGTGTVTDFTFDSLSGTPTSVDGGRDARLSKGRGRRPAYGQQYPRGYYNK